MTTTDCATDIAMNDIQEDEIQGTQQVCEAGSKPLKGLFFGFAATVTAGLALTSWYVGVRIVTADEVPPSSAAQNSAPAVRPSPTPSPASKPVVALTAQPAELYLQAAALGPKQDASFVRSLEAKGFRAHVQVPGSAPGNHDSRILIGPFPSRVDMEQAQLKLQSAGVLAIETTY